MLYDRARGRSVPAIAHVGIIRYPVDNRVYEFHAYRISDLAVPAHLSKP